MDPPREMGKLLLTIGGLMVIAGLLLVFSSKLPFRLGHLPGDIVHRTKNGLFYFPLVSCLLVSAFITLIGWLISLRK
jgi:hypothetical protein